MKKPMSDKTQENLEDEALHFKYTDKVPDWIVAQIEEWSRQFGADIMEQKHTLRIANKTHQSTWVCTRVDRLWDVTEVTDEEKENDPKKEEAPKQKPDTGVFTLHKDSQFVADLLFLGIDLRKETVSHDTLAWLLNGYRKANHPDKNGGDAELTQQAIQAVDRLKAHKK